MIAGQEKLPFLLCPLFIVLMVKNNVSWKGGQSETALVEEKNNYLVKTFSIIIACFGCLTVCFRLKQQQQKLYYYPGLIKTNSLECFAGTMVLPRAALEKQFLKAFDKTTP